MRSAASSGRDGVGRQCQSEDKTGDDQGAFHGSLPLSRELRSSSRMRQERETIRSNSRNSSRIGWLIARKQPIVSMYIYRRHEEKPPAGTSDRRTDLHRIQGGQSASPDA